MWVQHFSTSFFSTSNFTMSSTASISTKSTSTKIADSQDIIDAPAPEVVKVVNGDALSHFNWPKIKRTTIYVNGELKPGYRFIQDDNKVDWTYVDVMHEFEPFAAKHGEKEGLWKNVEEECKKRNSSSLFHDFTPRNGKDRLKQYQSFISKFCNADRKDSDATINNHPQNYC
jgi:hypothetical protein